MVEACTPDSFGGVAKRRAQAQITLPDGRKLGHDDHGPSDATPIFDFHGTPGSRCAWALFGDATLLPRTARG
jgi:hypothetical protein